MKEKPISDQYFQLIQDDMRFLEKLMEEDLDHYTKKFKTNASERTKLYHSGKQKQQSDPAIGYGLNISS